MDHRHHYGWFKPRETPFSGERRSSQKRAGSESLSRTRCGSNEAIGVDGFKQYLLDMDRGRMFLSLLASEKDEEQEEKDEENES